MRHTEMLRFEGDQRSQRPEQLSDIAPRCPYWVWQGCAYLSVRVKFVDRFHIGDRSLFGRKGTNLMAILDGPHPLDIAMGLNIRARRIAFPHQQVPDRVSFSRSFRWQLVVLDQQLLQSARRTGTDLRKWLRRALIG